MMDITQSKLDFDARPFLCEHFNQVIWGYLTGGEENVQAIVTSNDWTLTRTSTANSMSVYSDELAEQVLGFCSGIMAITTQGTIVVSTQTGQKATNAKEPPRTDFMIYFADAVRKIDRFREYGANWDSYDADPIRDSTVDRAIMFLQELYELLDSRMAIPIPFVAPCANGRILFEFRHGERELEFEIPVQNDAPVEYFRCYGEDEREGTIAQSWDITNLFLSLRQKT